MFCSGTLFGQWHSCICVYVCVRERERVVCEIHLISVFVNMQVNTLKLHVCFGMFCVCVSQMKGLFPSYAITTSSKSCRALLSKVSPSQVLHCRMNAPPSNDLGTHPEPNTIVVKDKLFKSYFRNDITFTETLGNRLAAKHRK